MTNQENKYNGWTNYATWRINLEMFDGWDSDGQEVTADSLQEIAEDHLSFEIDDGGRSSSLSISGGGLVLSYAMAFISEVNWYEIAQHINEEE